MLTIPWRAQVYWAPAEEQDRLTVPLSAKEAPAGLCIYERSEE